MTGEVTHHGALDMQVCVPSDWSATKENGRAEAIRKRRLFRSRRQHKIALRKSDRRCAYCRRRMWHPDWSIKDGEPGLRATVDHIVPLSRGGAIWRRNLAVVCYRCNQAKADRTEHTITTVFRENEMAVMDFAGGVTTGPPD